MTEKADRDKIRRQNRSVLLQALRRIGAQARIDLGRETRLSPATVTSITSDLISEGIVTGIEDPEQKTRATRGRPRALLSLDGGAARVLAVKLSVNKIEFALADYAGTVLARGGAGFASETTTASSFGETLVKAARGFLDGIAGGVRPSIISIAAQGVVDDSAGTVAWSPAFSERHVPVVAPMEAAFGVPCRLSNDTNMIAEALHQVDPERYGGTFAVIFIDYGVGMGLFVDNRLFVGETGAAAEIGHANHIPGGALCRCGRRGCLEAYLGDYAIKRVALGLDPQTQPARVDEETATIPDLVHAAEAGNKGAREAFASAGTALGYALARLSATLDPRRIAVTGGAMPAWPLLAPAVEAALREALVDDLQPRAAIDPIDWEEDLVLRGTLARGLHELDTRVFAEQAGSGLALHE
uniref:ROK family protein n=1 Tax=Stappia sp. TaxID=1870903 RepID=UPI003BA9F7D1